MGELYNPYPKLPKNIRQIGERDQMVKLYVEDYVNTYLKRLYPMGGQDLRVGLLLGDSQQQDGMPYLFIDGALELEGVTEDGEKVVFTETAWKKAYQTMEQMFPKRSIQGWFLCGAPGCQLSPLNYWKQHGQYFSGKNQLMYLNSGLEGEEAVYVTSNDGFYKLRGYSIYYERNQMMQDYMVMRKDVRRVETGGQDPVIQDFRKRLEDKKTEVKSRFHVVHTLGSVCAALAVVVMAGGVVIAGNYQKMKEMEGVLASVLPEGFQEAAEEGPELVVEELPGEVMPSTEELVIGLPETGTEGTQESGNGQPVSADTPVTGTDGQAVTGEILAGVPETIPDQQEKPAAIDPELTKNMTVYEVQPGETLYGICLKYYNSFSMIDEVCEINGLESRDKITAGQKLFLP